MKAPQHDAVDGTDVVEAEALAEGEELGQVAPVRIDGVRRQAALVLEASQERADGLGRPRRKIRDGGHAHIVAVPGPRVNDPGRR